MQRGKKYKKFSCRKETVRLLLGPVLRDVCTISAITPRIAVYPQTVLHSTPKAVCHSSLSHVYTEIISLMATVMITISTASIGLVHKQTN